MSAVPGGWMLSHQDTARQRSNLIHATTRMSLERARCWMKKAKFKSIYCITFMWNSRKGKASPLVAKIRTVVAKGQDGGRVWPNCEVNSLGWWECLVSCVGVRILIEPDSPHLTSPQRRLPARGRIFPSLPHCQATDASKHQTSHCAACVTHSVSLNSQVRMFCDGADLGPNPKI